VLIVSHDRDFLDRTVTVTLGLDGSGRVDIVAGGYEDWVRRKSSSSPSGGGGGRRPAEGERSAKSAPSVSFADSSPKGGATRKLSYKDQRDLDRLPSEVARIEAEIADAEQALHDPELYATNPERFAELTRRIAALRADKEAAEERWLEVAALAEALEA
jgi:ATP-binding cassette subfamily F protein uup